MLGGLVANEYLAGTFIALACGTVGWFVVLRAQVFAGDALGHVAFVGAILAAVLGVDERAGLFAATLAVGVAIAGLGGRGGRADTVTGIVFCWILGLGVLLLSILATSRGGGQGVIVANTLFGSITSIGAGPARLAAAVGLVVAILAAVCFRPLLSSTLHPELAALSGIPVRALGVAFLSLVAVVTAESAQAVGTLLLLGLLAAPAGAAHRLTARPWRGFLLSAAIAVAAMWGGLGIAYAAAAIPASSAIIALATLAYLVAGVASRRRPAVRPS